MLEESSPAEAGNYQTVWLVRCVRLVMIKRLHETLCLVGGTHDNTT